MKLIRYWFEFEIPEQEAGRYIYYSGLERGCGVSAYSYEDALAVLAEKLFRGEPIPRVRKVTENVDVSKLDLGHILPNMGVPTWRGVWFPRMDA